MILYGGEELWKRQEMCPSYVITLKTSRKSEIESEKVKKSENETEKWKNMKIEKVKVKVKVKSSLCTKMSHAH